MIANKHPLCCRVCRHNRINVLRKILFRSRRMSFRSNDLARRNIQIAEQIRCAIALIFILDTLRFARLHRLRRGRTRKCLNTCLFVNAYRMNSCGFVVCRRKIRLANLFYRTLKLFVILNLGIQPVAASMRRQVVFLRIRCTDTRET